MDEFDLGDKVTVTRGYNVITGLITGVNYTPHGTLYFVSGEWYVANELKKL